MDEKVKTALFLLPTLDQTSARHFAHIQLSEQAGVLSLVAAFARGDKKENIYLDRVDSVLGHIEHGSYLKRIPTYLKAIKEASVKMAASDIACCYTLDGFFLLWIASLLTGKKVKRVFFLLDVRAILLGEKLRNKFSRSLLRFAFKRSHMVVVSSSAFISEFAKKTLCYIPKQWMEIENKVNVSQIPVSPNMEMNPACSDTKKIVIGYYGLIRCARSINILGDLLRRWPDRYSVVLSGVYLGVEQEIAALDKLKGVEILGPYKNPDDLAQIYAGCDLVWGCYPYSSESLGNHQWAKTNRFYEACYFKKPLIVGIGTQDANEVQRHNIGKALDLGNIDSAVAELVDIDYSQVSQWQRNAAELPASVSTYQQEFEDLLLRLS